MRIIPECKYAIFAGKIKNIKKFKKIIKIEYLKIFSFIFLLIKNSLTKKYKIKKLLKTPNNLKFL